jgi:hypothetical protein
LVSGRIWGRTHLDILKINQYFNYVFHLRSRA